MSSSTLIEDFDRVIEKFDFSEIRNKTILITGSTGYIGSWICKFLAYSKEQGVWNGSILGGYRSSKKIDDSYSDHFKGLIDFVQLDVSNQISVQYKKKIDIIIHLASPTSSKELVSKPVDSINSIVTGTQNILDFCVKYDVEKLIYLSSMEIYNGYTEVTHVSEDKVGTVNPLIVRNCYPQGKLLAESMCSAYHSQYNVDVSIVRLAQTFGSGILKSENRVFAQFIKSAIRQENIRIKTDGMSISNFCDISDCVYSLLWLASRREGLEVFNICNEESTSTIKELAEEVINIAADDSISVVVEGEVPSFSNGYPANAMYKLDTSKARSAGLLLDTPLKTSINNAKKSIIENEYE